MITNNDVDGTDDVYQVIIKRKIEKHNSKIIIGKENTLDNID